MNRTTRLVLLHTMLRTRLFEEKVLELIEKDELEIGFHLLMGHEAVGAGVSAVLRPDDRITSNHRTMGRYLSRGGSFKKMMAEIFGKATGLCRGKAGEMLIADKETGLLFSSVTVGAGIPVAVGAAIGTKRYLGTDGVVATFFGDAASCNAPFHEALNMAAVHRAPVLFVCENNGLSINIPQREWMSTKTVAEKASAYGIPGIRVDGTDVEAVYSVASKAAVRARKGLGPTLIDAEVVRLRPHKEGLSDPRTKREMRALWRRDPVGNYARKLKSLGILTDRSEKQIRGQIITEVNDAVEYAKASPFPSDTELDRDLWTPATAELFSVYS